MTCSKARSQLAAPGSPTPEVAAHLRQCSGCARLAERLAIAGTALAAHHLAVEPDAGFAGRVAARLDRQPDPLSWAALRLLPVALALAVLATALAIDRRPSAVTTTATTTAAAAEAGTDDLLLWLADTSSGEENP